MFARLTPKAIALGTISALLMLMMAMGVEITKGFLFEIRKSLAAIEEAKASNKTAEAQYLDAINKLKAALETAWAMNNVGRMQAGATIDAANLMSLATIRAAERQAEGLYKATAESVRAENSQYDQIMKPLISDPAEKVAALNQKLVRLKYELTHPGPEAIFGGWSKAGKLAEIKATEEELDMLKESTTRTWKDALAMITGATDTMVGDLSKLSNISADRIPKDRQLKNLNFLQPEP